jgi:glutamine amidotransferase
MSVNLIKCGVGNVGSVINALKQIGCTANIVEKPDQFNLNFKKIILPGVGSFDSFIISLKQSGLFDKIVALVNQEKFSILGICVGLQSFFEKSEEGLETGLNLLKGNVIKIKSSPRIKIPHMGWNDLIIKKNNNLIKDIPKNKFYFAHSYYVNCLFNDNILASVTYDEEIPVVINYKNIYGVQFHPEKSFLQGQKIIKNFIDLC